jgi:LuxR family quorum-sensing system transcriptional regulator SolR
MNDIILPKTKILLPLMKETEEICQPLCHIGVVFFNYLKIYRDGSRIDLNNNHTKSYEHYYVDTTEYQNQSVESQPFRFKDNILLWSSFPDDKFWQVMRNEFNIANGITFLENHEHYCEIFHFASTRDNSQIVNFYLNNITSLKAFMIYFKEKGSKLLDNAEKNKLQIVNPSSLLQEENTIEMLDLNHEEFIKQLDSNRFNLKDNFNNVALTKRESECLALAMRGQSAKYIARYLGISHRTVEQYIERLKTKFNATSKFDLLHKVSATDYLHIHLDEISQTIHPKTNDEK